MISQSDRRYTSLIPSCWEKASMMLKIRLVRSVILPVFGRMAIVSFERRTEVDCSDFEGEIFGMNNTIAFQVKICKRYLTWKLIESQTHSPEMNSLPISTHLHSQISSPELSVNPISTHLHSQISSPTLPSLLTYIAWNRCWHWLCVYSIVFNVFKGLVNK